MELLNLNLLVWFWTNNLFQVHCGFMRNGGAEMDAIDVMYAKRCKFVVASGIFDGYDTPHQPSNISLRSQKLFCFLMVVDEKSLDFIQQNVSVKVDSQGGKWVGIWRLVVLHQPPFDEPRRNGKVPKILTHRLFPQAQYSIWIDGKMELIVDPLLILERFVGLIFSFFNFHDAHYSWCIDVLYELSNIQARKGMGAIPSFPNSYGR